jgi:hypothetical protein
MLMSDVGGGADPNGVNLTFDDEAAGELPDGAQITAGAYKPTQGTADCCSDPRPVNLPSPAPAGPYATSLSAFDGANPNGTYSLYVFDDTVNDSGQIGGGFSLDIKTTANPPNDLRPDLRMARLGNLQIQNTADGHKLLRFDSIIVNVGAGNFEARGSRLNTNTAEMTVNQRIYNDATGTPTGTLGTSRATSSSASTTAARSVREPSTASVSSTTTSTVPATLPTTRAPKPAPTTNRARCR